MSIAYLREVPLHVRLEAVRQLTLLGEDPAPLIELAFDPGDTSAVVPEEAEAEVVEGYCRRGHAWTRENIYIGGDGIRRCRACIREWNKGRGKRKPPEKVPCVFCGAPTLPPGKRGSGSIPIARCRACFYAQRRRVA